MAIDPMIGSALISAGGSLMGAIAGGSDTARDNRRQTYKLTRELAWHQPTWVRQGAQSAGFNPLTVLGANLSPATVTGATPEAPPLASIGAAMQTFGNAMFDKQTAEAQQKRTHDSAIAQLERVHELQQEAGGAAGVITRTVGAPLGSRAANAAAAASEKEYGGAAIDAARDVNVDPVMNTAGANVIENDWTGGPVYVPGSEPPEATDVVFSTPFIVPQIVRNWAGIWDYGGERKRIETSRANREKSDDFWQNYRGPVGPRMPVSRRSKNTTFNVPVR